MPYLASLGDWIVQPSDFRTDFDRDDRSSLLERGQSGTRSHQSETQFREIVFLDEFSKEFSCWISASPFIDIDTE